MSWIFGILSLACVDYSFESTVKSNLGADTGEVDPFLDGELDTAILDTAEEEIEEDIVEEDVASAKIYANTSGELYEVNPDTESITFIGTFMENGVPVDHFEDIAIDMSGHMYGGTGEFLYLINPHTAEVRAICPLDIATTALAFTSAGELIIGVDSTVYKMNIETCERSTLIAYSYYETSGDIVGLPDGYLYWSVRGGDSDRLVRVDPRTGYEEHIGWIGENRLYGMGYANDKLYGFSGNGRIVEINPATGYSTVMKELDATSWWGATTNPVVWE